MRTMYRAMFGLSLAALFAGPAFAQGGRGGGRGFGTYAGLLGNASVQKELKLDDEQTGKAKELAEKIRTENQEKYSGLQDLSQDERREKIQVITKEINETTMKAVGEFLKPEQITRLKQISYHQRGAAVFSDHEVAKKLNLTDTQKSEIHSIVQDMMAQNTKIREENQGDRETIMKKSAELRKETLEKAAAKLNDEQQKTWKELIGAPFEVKYEPRPQ